LESIVYVISQLIFVGGRAIAKGKGKFLPKVFAKFLANFGSSKFHQNGNTRYRM